LVHPDDLWPGATRDDARAVVAKLSGAAGVKAYSTSRAGDANITDVLELADRFREFTLSRVKEAEKRARDDGKSQIASELCRRRAALERALAERDRVQAQVDAAAARIERLQKAAQMFDNAVYETKQESGS
jgi:hypothetical protein